MILCEEYLVILMTSRQHLLLLRSNHVVAYSTPMSHQLVIRIHQITPTQNGNSQSDVNEAVPAASQPLPNSGDLLQPAGDDQRPEKMAH
ncbi:hypothetical protein HZ326_10606 [Fusarium oxysporum f. sp. albedinis]|nr:hypothetical protein HZ326_10606 [Fusarium oxysporum f. sp. albedinis]